MVHESFILDVAPGGRATSHEGKVLSAFLKRHCYLVFILARSPLPEIAT